MEIPEIARPIGDKKNQMDALFEFARKQGFTRSASREFQKNIKYYMKFNKIRQSGNNILFIHTCGLKEIRVDVLIGKA